MKHKPINIKTITPEQNTWLNSYQGTTCFEPMNLEELAKGEMSFNAVAKLNIDWYEQHMHDAYSSITDKIPYGEIPSLPQVGEAKTAKDL